jgi:hypothetical protein
MKVIIAGSRHMNDTPANRRIMERGIKQSHYDIKEIVSGTQRGADKLGERYAEHYNIPVTRFPANWNRYGKGAGPIRNTEMAHYADALIVFIWPQSRGSRNMLDTMMKLGKPWFAVFMERTTVREARHSNEGATRT